MNLSNYIEQMLVYKESLGYSRGTYEGFLKEFQAYFENAGFTEFSVNGDRHSYLACIYTACSSHFKSDGFKTCR